VSRTSTLSGSSDAAPQAAQAERHHGGPQFGRGADVAAFLVERDADLKSIVTHGQFSFRGRGAAAASIEQYHNQRHEGLTGKHLLRLSLSAFDPKGHSKHSLDLPVGLSHRLGDGNVVSCLHCMNE
jgi:hypothetical protein